MTTDEILQMERDIILEQTEDIVSDDDLLLYSNLAYRDVIKKAFPNTAVKSATVTFTAGVGAFPTDFGTLYGDPQDANGNVFQELSIGDFLRNDNSSNALVVEAGQFRVSPLATGSLVIRYYQAFETLADGVDPTIDDYLHESIVEGALYRAFRKLQDYELAQYYKNEFRVNLAERLDTLSNYEENSQKGGTMFNGIDILGGGVNNDPNHW